MKKISSALLLFLLPFAAVAQTMTYDVFIKTVAEKNTGYLAEKYSIDIAAANLQAARVFNDPELSVEYGNNQDWNLQMGQSVDVGLSYDLDLAGVRKARIAVARSESEITEASVAACLANLKFEASQAWAEAWRLRRTCEVLEASVRDMWQIARSDSLRLTVGDIGRADATQSRLEAQALSGELRTMLSEYSNALRNLSFLCGGEPVTEIADDFLPSREMPFTEDTVCDMAEANRADLKSAELSRTLSENNLRLVKASRAFDLGLNLGWSYNTLVRNEIAPAPKFNGLVVGVSIPLKFSSMNKGEVQAARAEVLQSQKYYESASGQVRLEASSAYNSLMAACEVLRQYDETMMAEAESIVESRRTGYLKGESSLVELLSAQQTYRDIMQAWIDASCFRYLCQAQLEQAIGSAW